MDATANQEPIHDDAAGAVQRVLAGALLTWILPTAIHVRRAAFGAS